MALALSLSLRWARCMYIKYRKQKPGKRAQLAAKSQARTYCNNTVVDPEAPASGLY